MARYTMPNIQVSQFVDLSRLVTSFTRSGSCLSHNSFAYPSPQASSLILELEELARSGVSSVLILHPMSTYPRWTLTILSAAWVVGITIDMCLQNLPHENPPTMIITPRSLTPASFIGQELNFGWHLYHVTLATRSRDPSHQITWYDQVPFSRIFWHF